MRVLEQRILRGPNLWTELPCLQTLVDFGDAVAAPHQSVRALVADHGAGLTQPEFLAELARALQARAGVEAAFATARPLEAAPAQARIVFSFEAEKLACESMQLALDLLAAADPVALLEERMPELKETAQRYAIGTSTRAVVMAAQARGIPTLRITDEANLFQLGWGKRQKRLQATITADTSHIAVGIAANKQLTKTLLEQAGIPVPKGGVVASAVQAAELAAKLTLPVTVKPLDGNQGKGVSACCRSLDEVQAAYDYAREYGRRIIVERHIEGSDYRILVGGGRVAAASLRRPPAVRGDGVSTIEQLVARENQAPSRGEGHTTILTRISLDEQALSQLHAQGYTPASVPPRGAAVSLRANANLSTGGTAEDVTERVHPDTARMCVRAAEAIGLDIAGIDLVCTDIERSLRGQGGAIIEVNAAPGIRMHEFPVAGQARNAGDAIVESMFGKSNGRIPIIAVTGTNGKTTTTLMIGHCARRTGLVPGVTTTEGVYIDGSRILEGDCAGFHSARAVLASNAVDIAVLETARGGILKRGLAFDRCTIGVVLNVSADHLGLDGVETVEQLAVVKGLVARNAARAAVLNADDPHCVAMAGTLRRGAELIYFSMQADNPVLLQHLARGGRATYLDDGTLIVADGTRRHRLLQASTMPASLGGHARYNVANALAAAAALLGAGFRTSDIASGLSSFVSDAASNPLRSNVYKIDEVTVMVDYAHNPAAYEALSAMARSFGRGRRVAVVTSPGDRRDSDLQQLGRTCAAGFDALFAYEANARGRADGEISKLIVQGARAAGMDGRHTHAVVPVAEAFAQAMAACRPGDMLIFACGSASTATEVLAPYLQRAEVLARPVMWTAPGATAPAKA
ncbi:MAG: cyanophycin synthetase [Pseudomonadota bacterium]